MRDLIARIPPVDDAARVAAERTLDAKTKPRHSLGRLEQIAARIVAIRGFVPAGFEAAVVVAAGDHGVAAEGVSAYPQEVTAQMVLNFAGGGAAINVLARQADARLIVVDAGVAVPVEHELVRSLRVGPGTANLAAGPAMPVELARKALVAGVGIADELAALGLDAIALGEMGIGNTTSASALAAALLHLEPATVCGRGTGLDDEGVMHKVATVERALAVNDVDPSDALAVLAALGGFEIAMLVGVALGCAANHVVCVLDGFITSAAALVAAELAPLAVGAMIASHRSTEPGHAIVLEALGLEPVLDLGLRLGEGSGAALALPVLRSSIAVLNEMATFADAGVTDAGR
jgi:nicotinate-nucleotide--dimethylbenzimidazole phosphoribosyltransferase